ncbi:MAG: hypothetical protein ACE5FC_02845 [Myxococcota bacterium]
MTLVLEILKEPRWLQAWVGWLLLVNTGALVFWKVREARIIFWVFAANAVFMTALCELNGYNKLLGISHVLFWTPMLVWLVPKLPGFDRAAGFGKWVVVLAATDAISLVIDYADVARYILGEPR